MYPYTFRQICANGSIIANALPGRHIERAVGIAIGTPSHDGHVILAELREAVQACASPDAFSVITHDMQAISSFDGSRALHALRRLARMQPRDVTPYLPLIFGRFATSDDQSAYGVMNAVTSIARDTADPAVRWSLEQIGGSIPAYLTRRPRVAQDTAVLAETETEVLV